MAHLPHIFQDPIHPNTVVVDGTGSKSTSILVAMIRLAGVEATVKMSEKQYSYSGEPLSAHVVLPDSLPYESLKEVLRVFALFNGHVRTSESFRMAEHQPTSLSFSVSGELVVNTNFLESLRPDEFRRIKVMGFYGNLLRSVLTGRGEFISLESYVPVLGEDSSISAVINAGAYNPGNQLLPINLSSGGYGHVDIGTITTAIENLRVSASTAITNTNRSVGRLMLEASLSIEEDILRLRKILNRSIDLESHDVTAHTHIEFHTPTFSCEAQRMMLLLVFTILYEAGADVRPEEFFFSRVRLGEKDLYNSVAVLNAMRSSSSRLLEALNIVTVGTPSKDHGKESPGETKVRELTRIRQEYVCRAVRKFWLFDEILVLGGDHVQALKSYEITEVSSILIFTMPSVEDLTSRPNVLGDTDAQESIEKAHALAISMLNWNKIDPSTRSTTFLLKDALKISLDSIRKATTSSLLGYPARIKIVTDDGELVLRAEKKDYYTVFKEENGALP